LEFRRKALNVAWYEQNKTKKAEKSASWFKENKERWKKYNASLYEAKKEIYQANGRKWRQLNPEKTRAHRAKYRASKLQATPSWANLDKIEQIYLNCPKGHEVDHIIPLQSNDVCGLHVECNLQYLPVSDNRRKGNQLIRS
jgi:hypothetical protein